MPKDTKKFINPLLRPSQSTEFESAIQEKVQLEPPEPEVVPIVEDTVLLQNDENIIEQAQDPLPITTSLQSGPEPAIEETSPPSVSKGTSTKKPKSGNSISERTTYTSPAYSRTRNDFTADSFSDDESLKPNGTDEGSRPGVKRRRHTLPFESTHERITLWVDKELKEQFEDLAYRRSLSKTALLNEALADLLAKFEKR